MRKDLDNTLVSKFPNLYRDRNAERRTSQMAYGFTTGNGWYPLIADLSKKLEKMILALPENKRKFYKATQVKQKFGGLRFYMYDRTAEMREAIAEAEAESFVTCECCGRAGELIQEPGRWITVACHEHRDITRLADMDALDVHWSVKLLRPFKKLVGK